MFASAERTEFGVGLPSLKMSRCSMSQQRKTHLPSTLIQRVRLSSLTRTLTCLGAVMSSILGVNVIGF
jgi:hypothetical protein